MTKTVTLTYIGEFDGENRWEAVPKVFINEETKEIEFKSHVG